MENSNNRKRIIGSVVGTVVAVLVAFFVQQYFFKAPTFDKAMMDAASQINQSCPIMVDQETRLDNAVAMPGKVFQYNYTLVNLAKDSINISGLESYIKPMILNNVKTNPDMKGFRDNKVTMIYNYKDKDGIYITRINITPDMYEK
jgi:uncharacterized membrane protein YukC